MSVAATFSDLRQRLLSAVVLVIVGIGAIYLGGLWLLWLLALAGGLMIWELLRMLAPDMHRNMILSLSIMAAGTVIFALSNGLTYAPALLIVPFYGLVFVKNNRALFAVYSGAILLAVGAMYGMRVEIGLLETGWFILVVVASDVGGYLAGRAIGGPKILPKISPKKTWSGTVGGWVLAAVLGYGYARYFGINNVDFLVVLSVFTAAAAQIGDVAESSIKRHAGVKDSSRLIPGHGGLLDRFDGMIGGILFVSMVFLYRLLSMNMSA